MNGKMTVCTVALILLFRESGHAAPVQLQQPTATFSQTMWGGSHAVATSIDGVYTGGIECGGWAIYPNNTSQTAVFETSGDVGFAGGTVLTFTLFQNWFEPGHTLGRFRLSVTTDARDTFADGLARDGDVSATWIVLDPSSLRSVNGTTLTAQPDLSIVASGNNPGKDTYSISAVTLLRSITGIRLEALNDSSLPNNGPGRYTNGNFVLSELQLDATMLPFLLTSRIRLPGDSVVEISWLSQSNRTYGVDCRSDMMTNEWASLFSNIVGNGETNYVYDTVANGQRRRFYRVIASP